MACQIFREGGRANVTKVYPEQVLEALYDLYTAFSSRFLEIFKSPIQPVNNFMYPKSFYKCPLSNIHPQVALHPSPIKAPLKSENFAPLQSTHPYN